MSLYACPSGVAVVEVEAKPPLRVELSLNRPAFRNVGSYGFSPIGSFADWAAEPAETRRALDAVVTCAKSDPPDALLVSDGQPSSPSRDGPRRPHLAIPFLAIAACLLSLGAFLRSPRRVAHQRKLARFAGVFALAVVVLALTRFAFFHQNGQGPFWVAQAVIGDGGDYGPGYPEMFQWLSVRAQRPDDAIAIAHLILGALLPLLAYVIARGVGARRIFAAVLAAAALFDPVFKRTSRSESYFATIAVLLFAAAAALILGDRPQGARSRWKAVLGPVIAGLFIAQAARIHPLAWVPAAAVPLVLLCRGGDLRVRVVRTAIAAIVIAFVAAPFVVPLIRHTFGSGLGTGFLGGARVRVLSLSGRAAIAIAIGLALLVPRATRRFAAPMLAAIVAVAAAIVTNVVQLDTPVVSAAYLHLFAPALLGGIAGLAALVARPKIVAAVIALIALGHVWSERRIVALPTDARELDWWRTLRDELPNDAQVATIDRVGSRVLFLPLFGTRMPRTVRIEDDGRAWFGPGPRYYYRSSLCVTAEGAARCERFEQTHRLREVSRRTFPSLASLPWHPLPGGSIDVAIFAVE